MRLTAFLPALVVSAGIVLAPLTPATADDTQLIRIVTTSPGVPWNILGARVASELNERLPNVSASGSTGGSTSNIVDVAADTAQMGWTVHTTALEAVSGTGDFEGREVTNFEVIAPFAVTPFHIAARKGTDIESLEDLESKRFNIGEASWGTTALTLRVLERFDITPDSVRRSGGLIVNTGYDAWQTQMQDGTIDAVIYWGGIPSSLTISLINEPGIDFVYLRDEQVEKILSDDELGEFLMPMALPAEAYEPLERDYHSFTYSSIAIANPDLDDDIAYETAKILVGGAEEDRVYKDGLSQTHELVEIWLAGNTLPLHPGAERYFKEIGLLE